MAGPPRRGLHPHRGIAEIERAEGHEAWPGIALVDDDMQPFIVVRPVPEGLAIWARPIFTGGPTGLGAAVPQAAVIDLVAVLERLAADRWGKDWRTLPPPTG